MQQSKPRASGLHGYIINSPNSPSLFLFLPHMHNTYCWLSSPLSPSPSLTVTPHISVCFSVSLHLCCAYLLVQSFAGCFRCSCSFILTASSVEIAALCCTLICRPVIPRSTLSNSEQTALLFWSTPSYFLLTVSCAPQFFYILLLLSIISYYTPIRMIWPISRLIRNGDSEG